MFNNKLKNQNKRLINEIKLLKEPKSIIGMSEIINPLIKLTEGIPYNPSSSEEYVITLNHSLSDILRFAIDQSDIEEIETLINVIKQETRY